ncbi:MAG: DMT family transporter [Pirellulales bacterium]
MHVAVCPLLQRQLAYPQGSFSQSGVSPWIGLLFRAGVGTIVVATVFRGSNKVNFMRAATNRMLAGRGLLGVLGTIAYYFTIPALGPGKATLISNTYVVIAALMAAWILREAFSFGKLAGNLLAMVGLTLLLWPSLTAGSVGWYEMLAVVGALAAAGTVIIIRQLTRSETTAMIYASQCIYVLASAIPFACIELMHHSLTVGDWTLLLFAGGSATVGQLAMTEGFRHLTVSVGGVFQICVPIVISLGSVLLFQESFMAVQVAGAVLILAGCYWVMTLRS